MKKMVEKGVIDNDFKKDTYSLEGKEEGVSTFKKRDVKRKSKILDIDN